LKTQYSSQRGTKTISGQEYKAQLAEQLTRLEDDLRRLKIEFDIFLNGGSKRPPYETKNRVDTTLKRLADDRGMPYAQRYLYNTLVGRYAAFQNFWRRSMQSREEGHKYHVPHHKVAVYAARQAAQEAPPEPSPSSEPSPSPVPETALPPARPTSFTCADATRDQATVQAMYESFVEAKKQCGENPNEVPYEFFQKVVAGKTASLRERYKCPNVRFSVEVENGKVNFKAQANI
jgi:hypothetical protein